MLKDGLVRTASEVALPLVRAFPVVVEEPRVEVALERLDRLVEPSSEGAGEELLADRPLEAPWANPFVCGRRTRVVRCSISASAR